MTFVLALRIQRVLDVFVFCFSTPIEVKFNITNRLLRRKPVEQLHVASKFEIVKTHSHVTKPMAKSFTLTP